MLLPSLSSVLLGAGFVTPHAHFISQFRGSAGAIPERADSRAAVEVLYLLQPTALADHHLNSHKAELAAAVDEVLKPNVCSCQQSLLTV
jgi:hypothetical protein